MTKCTGMRCPMQYGYKVEECNQTDCPYRTEPITNADRIRAMSDEELIQFFILEDKCPENISTRECDGFESCKDCWIHWLQQPAEVDNG